MTPSPRQGQPPADEQAGSSVKAKVGQAMAGSDSSKGLLTALKSHFILYEFCILNNYPINYQLLILVFWMMKHETNINDMHLEDET